MGCNLKTLEQTKLELACENFNAWVNYKNIVTTFVLHKIFTLINQTCVFLQKANLCFVEGIKSLKKCNQMLDNLKNTIGNCFEEADDFVKKVIQLLNDDEEIQSLKTDIICLPTEDERKEMIENLRLEFCCFIKTLQNRIDNYILTQFDHKDSIYREIQSLDARSAKDEILNGTESINIMKLCEINNIDHYITVQELKQLVLEFLPHSNRSQSVSVLNNIDKSSIFDEETDDEQLTLILEDENDFDETSANVHETKFEKLSKACYCYLCVLKYISEVDERKEKLSNIFRLYRYVALIPATQVKCERDFSELKLIKTRLRANTFRLSLLFDCISLNDIVDRIIEKSTRISIYMNT